MIYEVVVRIDAVEAVRMTVLGQAASSGMAVKVKAQNYQDSELSCFVEYVSGKVQNTPVGG